MTIDNHKHCIFCGDVIGTTLFCESQLNPIPPDTVGHRPHAWQAITFGGTPPTIKERARIAAERARQSTEPVRLLSMDEHDGEPIVRGAEAPNELVCGCAVPRGSWKPSAAPASEREAVLEEAAKVAEQWCERIHLNPHGIAGAIRALKGKE